MIVAFIFNAKGVKKPSYIDIGANDPYKFSNTAYFYENGCRGINVEPNPILFEKFLLERNEDVNLNVGMGKEKDNLNFYMLKPNTMSSFSEQTVKELCAKYDF